MERASANSSSVAMSVSEKSLALEDDEYDLCR